MSKKFNLKEAMAGRPVINNKGCKARILATDMSGPGPILVAYMEGDVEKLSYHHLDGTVAPPTKDKSLDLMMDTDSCTGFTYAVQTAHGGVVISSMFHSREDCTASMQATEGVVSDVIEVPYEKYK